MNLQRRIKIKPLAKKENKVIAEKLNTRDRTFLALQEEWIYTFKWMQDSFNEKVAEVSA